MKYRRKAILFLSAIPIAIVVLFAGMSMLSKRPTDLGLQNGKLRDCPSSPNCVSTRASRASQRMESIPLTGTADEAVDRLKQIIQSMPRAKIVTEQPNYLHAEFSSLVFRFVDDVEFHIDEAAGQIHFRSASRVGHSDMGVNRARMEKIRKAFVAAPSSSEQ